MAHGGEGIAPERLDFGGRELAPLARQQIAERKPAHGNAFELVNLVAQLRKHATNLAILAFVENHFQDCALFVLTSERHALGMNFSLGQAYALAESLEQLGRRYARNLHEVFFLDTVARVGEKVRELAVVREQDEAFARTIKTPDGEETTITGHEIDDARPAGRVVVGCHHADWLMEQIHDAPRIGEPLPVDTNLLGARIDLRAERGDDLAIDLHAAGGDKLLAGSTTSQTGCSQHLLEPLEPVVGTRIARSGRTARAARANRAPPLSMRGTTVGFLGRGHETLAAKFGGTCRDLTQPTPIRTVCHPAAPQNTSRRRSTSGRPPAGPLHLSNRFGVIPRTRSVQSSSVIAEG